MKKIMIASDLHGDAVCVRKLLDAYEKSGADKLLLLGDLLYHGPRNDLPSGYAPKEVISMLNGVKDELLCVRGNCDTEVDAMVLDFPILADYAYVCVDDIVFFATHGHKYNTDCPPYLKEGEILLHGHTHISGVTPFGNRNLYVNPGSVSIPKADTPKGFILYSQKVLSFRELDGREYSSMDISHI